MSDDDWMLDRERLYELLVELGRRLHAQGLQADMYVVGGAAVALTLDTRRTTRDVDAAFRPPVEVAEVALAMARDEGLPPGWLSSAAMAFAPSESDPDAVALDVTGLSVAVASPRHLLAMKLAAGRQRDLADLVVLFERLGISTPDQALAIAKDLYGEDSAILSDPDESYIWLAQDVLDLIEKKRR
jgi:hypothetical protein